MEIQDEKWPAILARCELYFKPFLPEEQASKFCAQVWLASDEKASTAILEKDFSGITEDKGSLTKLTMYVREVSDMIASLRNHALCLLDNGNMLASTNYWCRTGDEVFVFPGADNPFLVRREFGGYYRLVGVVLVDRPHMIGYQKWRA